MMLEEENNIKIIDEFTEDDLDNIENIDEDTIDYILTEYDEETMEEFLSKEEEKW